MSSADPACAWCIVGAENAFCSSDFSAVVPVVLSSLYHYGCEQSCLVLTNCDGDGISCGGYKHKALPTQQFSSIHSASI